MRLRSTAWWGGPAVVLALVSSAYAATPLRSPIDDAKRFGLDKPEPRFRRPTPAIRKAFGRFKTGKGRVAAARYTVSGRIAGLSGRLSGPRAGTPHEVAMSFLRENQDLLGVDPSDIQLLLSRRVGNLRHLLYQQTYNGLPVEFSRVKAHLSDKGEVLGIDSGYIPPTNWPTAPTVSVDQAAQAVAADLGVPPPSGGTLVYLPVYKTGEVRLAWKFKVSGKGASWLYYIDALTGGVLFRYDTLSYQCQTGGTVTGLVYDMNSSQSALAGRPIANQYVYVYNNATTFVATNAGGTFCSVAPGKIYAALQGPYAVTANYKNSAAHYDNGGGVWFTAATAVSSPNPYPNGAAVPNSVVFVATINSPTPPVAQFGAGAVVVKAEPIFSFFNVGQAGIDTITGSYDISDDDEVQILDTGGNAIATYTGNRSQFNGAAVQGINPAMRVAIVANPDGVVGPGYTVSVSSFLVLTQNPTIPAVDSSFQWSQTMTADGSIDEINAFYHVNKMHDYFTADIDSNGQADISHPALAMVHVGPSLYNAFFNPDYNDLFFGDGAAFALDATVVHHEYTHWVVNKIYPVINFGQFGAISEAMADYFSASSLNQPAIGGGIGSVFGSSEGALRNLACNRVTQSPKCDTFPADWTGEIHDDSLPLSQSVWDLRANIGQACADELAFQTLFYFPDSFEEFLNAMLSIDAQSPTLTPQCGAANAVRGSIINAFAFHGITIGNNGGDQYEPNDGSEDATDISTLTVISATIFPTGDLDFYTFGAAPGMINAVLSLPANPQNAGSHFAYSLQLLDRQLNTLLEVDPPIDVNPTVNGGCPQTGECLTSAATVNLTYNNPAANQFYAVVSAAPDDFGDNGGANSSIPYSLQVSYPRQGSLSAAVVSASYDNDVIHFSVEASSFVKIQNFSFDHAVLRDQGLNVLSNTATNGASPLLVMVSSLSVNGTVSGTLRLAPGFANRYPAVGTVYVEVYGVDRLQAAACAAFAPGTPCLSQSMGLSNALSLTTNQTALTAWNNVFNPMLGQKATFKYELTQPGHVRLRLYTSSGRLVSTLVDQDLPAGKNSVDWNGKTGNGIFVASGIYLLNLQGPGVNQTQKVIVVK